VWCRHRQSQPRQSEPRQSQPRRLGLSESRGEPASQHAGRKPWSSSTDYSLPHVQPSGSASDHLRPCGKHLWLLTVNARNPPIINLHGLPTISACISS